MKTVLNAGKTIKYHPNGSAQRDEIQCNDICMSNAPVLFLWLPIDLLLLITERYVACKWFCLPKKSTLFPKQ